MAVYLAAIFIYASFAFNPQAGLSTLVKGFIIVILYACFDLLWTFIRDKVWYFPLSSFISGFVIAIVSIPNPPLYVLILLPLLAVFSKQLLHFGKMRHVFNPASFAMVVMSFFLPAVSWWGTSWDIIGLVVISIFGLFILWRQERWHVTIPFLFSYTICLSLFLLLTGITSDQLPNILNAELVNGTVLFFSTVMLIEPLTSTFPTHKQRTVYGILVGFFSVAVMYILKLTGLPHQDPLVVGLLLGNLTAGLLFLPNRKKAMIKPPMTATNNNELHG